MFRAAVLALLLSASWSAVASAKDAIKYETASAPVAAKPGVVRKVPKRTVAAGRLILLGIGY